jgi:AcrR family transcriptional regulator
MPEMAPIGPPDAPQTDIRTRAVEATLACVARHGLGKTTLDDVAREAGCARATLYRHVGGKQQLAALAVAAEAERITATLHAAAAEHDSLADALVAVILSGAREITSHPAIQFLLGFEPDLALPYVTFDAGDRLFAHARAALAPCFERFLDRADAERAGEWATRVTLAYAYRADAPVDIVDESAVRNLVHQFIEPAFRSTPEPVSGATTRG